MMQRSLSIIKRIRPLLILAIMLITVLHGSLPSTEGAGFPLREVILVQNLMRFTGAPEGQPWGICTALFLP
jgi:hypothetical protein